MRTASKSIVAVALTGSMMSWLVLSGAKAQGQPYNFVETWTSVIGFRGTPPASPELNDMYIVQNGTDEWLGQDNNVAEYTIYGWTFTAPYGTVWVSDLEHFFRFSPTTNIWEVQISESSASHTSSSPRDYFKDIVSLENYRGDHQWVGRAAGFLEVYGGVGTSGDYNIITEILPKDLLHFQGSGSAYYHATDCYNTDSAAVCVMDLLGQIDINRKLAKNTKIQTSGSFSYSLDVGNLTTPLPYLGPWSHIGGYIDCYALSYLVIDFQIQVGGVKYTPSLSYGFVEDKVIPTNDRIDIVKEWWNMDRYLWEDLVEKYSTWHSREWFEQYIGATQIVEMYLRTIVLTRISLYFAGFGPIYYDLQYHGGYSGDFKLDHIKITGIQPPVVSTSPATDVTKDSATLNGSVTDDGGEACQYRFRYKDEKGDYVYTSWTGSVTTGQSFSQAISDLKANATYYVSAQAKNSAGEGAWGNEQTFVARPAEIPVASFKYKQQNPKTGQNVQFDASSSKPADPDGTILTYRWFFGDDGTSTVETQPFCNHTFKKAGEWAVSLYVTDDDYLEASTTSTVKVKPNEFMITFDDGPYSVSTRYILDQLSRIAKADGTPVKAGFFLIGKDKSRTEGDVWKCPDICPDPGVISNPDVVREIAAAGHLIGVHTQHHPNLSILQPQDVVSEILDCDHAIVDAGVIPIRVFRSPGLKDPQTLPGTLKDWRIIQGTLTDDWLPDYILWPLGWEEWVIGRCRDILQTSTGNSPVILIFHDFRGRPGHELNFYNIIMNELVNKDGFVLVDFQF